jgi:hypothetical protein
MERRCLGLFKIGITYLLALRWPGELEEKHKILRQDGHGGSNQVPRELKS